MMRAPVLAAAALAGGFPGCGGGRPEPLSARHLAVRVYWSCCASRPVFPACPRPSSRTARSSGSAAWDSRTSRPPPRDARYALSDCRSERDAGRDAASWSARSSGGSRWTTRRRQYGVSLPEAGRDHPADPESHVGRDVRATRFSYDPDRFAQLDARRRGVRAAAIPEDRRRPAAGAPGDEGFGARGGTCRDDADRRAEPVRGRRCSSATRTCSNGWRSLQGGQEGPQPAEPLDDRGEAQRRPPASSRRCGTWRASTPRWTARCCCAKRRWRPPGPTPSDATARRSRPASAGSSRSTTARQSCGSSA